MGRRRRASTDPPASAAEDANAEICAADRRGEGIWGAGRGDFEGSSQETKKAKPLRNLECGDREKGRGRREGVGEFWGAPAVGRGDGNRVGFIRACMRRDLGR